MTGGFDVDGGCGEGNESSGRGRSRRDVLRASAGIAATGLSAASAGCLATLPPLGERVTYGPVDAPTADDATYTEWIPDANDVDGETTVRNDEFIMYMTPNDLGADEIGQAPSFPVSYVKSRVDYFGHEFERYDEAINVGNAIVLLGDIDTELVAETAIESGYDAVDAYEGYDAYSRSDPDRAVLVDDDVIVWRAGSRAMADVQATVDARDGRTRRLVDANEDFAAVTATSGQSPWTWVDESSAFADDGLEPDWTATNFEFDDDGVYYTRSYLFPEGDVPSKGAVRDWMEEQSRPVDSEAVEVAIDDRVVSVEMQMSVGEFREGLGVEPDAWPQITWSVSEDGGQLTLTHEAGDSVEMAWLAVTYYPSRKVDGDVFAPADETLEPGDSVTIDTADVPADTERVSVGASPPSDDSVNDMLSVPIDDAEYA